MAQELESHMRKEEDVLFPMIARGHGAMADAPITVMRMEHDDHGVALRRMEELTDGITARARPAPPGVRSTPACGPSART